MSCLYLHGPASHSNFGEWITCRTGLGEQKSSSGEFHSVCSVVFTKRDDNNKSALVFIHHAAFALFWLVIELL